MLRRAGSCGSTPPRGEKGPIVFACSSLSYGADAVTRRELAIDLAPGATGDGRTYLVYQPVVDVMDIRNPAHGGPAALAVVPAAVSSRRRNSYGFKPKKRWQIGTASARGLGGAPPVRGRGELAGTRQCFAVADSRGRLQFVRRRRTGAVAGCRRAGSNPRSPRTRCCRTRGEIIGAFIVSANTASPSRLRRAPASRRSAISRPSPSTGWKIDRSFVADGSRDAGSAAIIAATVQLARAFDIEVTGEGVETPEQLGDAAPPASRACRAICSGGRIRSRMDCP